MIRNDTGSSLSDLFVEFDEEPIGTGKYPISLKFAFGNFSDEVSASLAQVHRARLRETGEESVVPVKRVRLCKLILTLEEYRVAVKLQHPSLAEWVPLDLSLTRFALTNIKFFFPEYPMDWLSDEMELS